MQRRLFIKSGSLALTTAGLAACGGGSGGAEGDSAEAQAQALQAPEDIEQQSGSFSTSAGAAAYPAWVAGRFYAAGAIVRYTDGRLYIAKHANPGYTPTISTYFWAPYTAPASGTYPAWVAGQPYAAGAIVRYTDGNLYIAKHANPGYNPTISTWYWSPHEAAGPAPAPAAHPAWVAGQAYAAGAIVRYTDGNLYIAKHANPGYNPTISTWYWAPHGVAAPSPSPSPSPAPADGLPAKILGCYFTAWDTSYRLTDVALDFNVIYLFHATPAAGGNGAFVYQYGNNVTAAQVQTCRQRGQKVILTVGGANAGFAFTTRTQSQNFVNSFRQMATALGGVDGCDFNNFEAGLAPSATEMIWICQQLRATYGSAFAITSPPAPWSAQDKAMCKAMTDAGVVTYTGPQYYDSEGFRAPGYVAGSIRDWVTNVAGGDASKIVVGFSANYGNGLTLDESVREWTAVKANHPAIRGMFCWSAQTNMAGGNTWARTMKARLA